jgi:hypothetical protein
MKANKSFSMRTMLLRAIASLFHSNDLKPEDKSAQLKNLNRQYHYSGGGGNPEFHPKRTKFKGYMRNK